MDDTVVETGAEGNWSPIRTEENVPTVLVAAEGEHAALLGLARGLIVPVVRDDLTTAVGGLPNPSAPVKHVQKESTPHVSEPLLVPKASHVNRPTSSSTRSSTAAKSAPKQPSRPPSSKLPKPKKSPSNPSPVRAQATDPLASRGVSLRGNRPPPKAVLVLGGADQDSVPNRGVLLQGNRPPQKVGSVSGGSLVSGNEQGRSSAALADAFLAGVQVADLTHSQNGNDLLFTFSDESDDDAPTTDSLQSEMDRLRAQMQKLEAGRKTPEPEGVRTGGELEAGGPGKKLDAGQITDEKNGSRPSSGGTRPGVLSRFAGRLGPLKGGVISGTAMSGGQVPVGKDPPVAVIAKAMPVDLSLEAMRKRVALMEQEVKQGGVKVGRLVPPSASQNRKVNDDKGASLAASTGAVKEAAAAQTGEKTGSGGVFSRLENPGKVAGGTVPAAKDSLGLAKAVGSSVVPGVVKVAGGHAVVNVGKKLAGSPAQRNANGLQKSEKPVSHGERPSQGNKSAPANKPLMSASGPLMSQIDLDAQPKSAPPVGRDFEASLARTGSGKVNGGRGDVHRSPNGGGRFSPQKKIVPGEIHGLVERTAGQSPNKRKVAPGEGQPVLQTDGVSPKKRKAAPAENDRVLKQPKLEKTVVSQRVESANRPTSSYGDQTFPPGIIAPEARPAVLMTSADRFPAEAGALVVFGSTAVMSAERQLAAVAAEAGVASAERQLAVTSADHQLAVLATEEDRCWAELQQGEEDVLVWGRKRDELREALLEVDRKELEARAWVAAMQERMAGNRRLRTELELRGRLEKRLQHMMNGGAGLESDRGIGDGAGGIGDGPEGISDGARGLEASAGEAYLLTGITERQNRGRVGGNGTGDVEGKDGLATTVPELAESASDGGVHVVEAREMTPGPAATGAPPKASDVTGVKGPNGKELEKAKSQLHEAKGSQALTAGRARETSGGGRASGDRLGVKSPGKKARPKVLPAVQSPGGKGRPNRTGEVAKSPGQKAPGGSKPAATKGHGSPVAERPGVGVGGQAQQKVVGEVGRGQKADAGKGRSSDGHGVEVHIPVSGGQNELRVTPPVKEQPVLGLSDRYVLSENERLEEFNREQRQSVGRKRWSEGELLSQDATSKGVGATEIMGGFSEPLPKRTRLEGAKEAEKQSGETRRETGLSSKDVGVEVTVGEGPSPVAGTSAFKAGVEANFVEARGSVGVVAGEKVEAVPLEKLLAERSAIAGVRELDRANLTGQPAGNVDKGGAGDAVAGGSNLVIVGEKRVRDVVEEATERKKATGEREVGGEVPLVSLVSEKVTKGWTVGEAVGKAAVDPTVALKAGESRIGLDVGGEKAAVIAAPAEERVGEEATESNGTGVEPTRGELVTLEEGRKETERKDASWEVDKYKNVGELRPGAEVGEAGANGADAGMGGSVTGKTAVCKDPEGAVTEEQPVELQVRSAAIRTMMTEPSTTPGVLPSGSHKPRVDVPGAAVAEVPPEYFVSSASLVNGRLTHAMAPDPLSPPQDPPKRSSGGAVPQPNSPPGTVHPPSSIQPENRKQQLDSESPPVRTEPLEPSKYPKPPNPFWERLAELQASTSPPRGAYKGALTAFKSFRLTPQYREIWAREFGSLTWSNDVIPDWPMCTAELLTGQCGVRDCGFQHVRDYVLEDEALLAQLKRYGTAVILPRGEDTPLEQRAAHVVEQLERRKIGAPTTEGSALKKWNEAPVPIYRVGNYLMDHRERSLPTGRGFSVPRAVSSPVLSPGIVRPLTLGMPFIGDLEADGTGGTFAGWRYWERIAEGDKDRESESWEVALERALDVVDNNLAIRNTEKLDEALAVLARALEENRHVPSLWAVYLELFIRRAKDDSEATQMIEAAVRFNPGSAALWIFYFNTRGSPSEKLRVCQRARSSILASLAAKNTRDNFGHSAALLDFTLRAFDLLVEIGNESALSDEVRALVLQALPERAAVVGDGSNSGTVVDGSLPGAGVVKPGETAEKAGGGERATTQSAESERVALLGNLSTADSVTFWISCAYLLGYGRLPKRVASRLGYEQPVPPPEDIWQTEGDQLPLLPGSGVAVFQVFNVAAKALCKRASLKNTQVGLHALASHNVAVTALLLGSKQAVTVCERLLGIYPGHTDLAFRRAAMLLGEAPENRPQTGESHRSQTEVSEALRCLCCIVSQPGPTATEPLTTESNGERCLALLRSAQLLLTWSSKEAAVECLAQLFDDASNDCLEAVCCSAMKAALEGDRSEANLLVESVNPSLVRTAADVRLLAELRASFVAQSPEVAIRSLAGVSRPGLDNPVWPALTLTPVAPPWADVTSEGLKKQVSRAWVSKPAWDYDLVNRVIFAWLPQLKTANNLETATLVDTLEALLTLVPGNVPLSLLSDELCQTRSCDSWRLPLVLQALTSARPEPLAEFWESLAERCSKAGESTGADEVRLLAKRARSR